jgi:hypothetical protein
MAVLQEHNIPEGAILQFCQWFITLRINGFLDLAHHLEFKIPGKHDVLETRFVSVFRFSSNLS